MADQRLSKLQKWILEDTFKEGIFNRNRMRAKFNKGPDGNGRTTKQILDGYSFSNSERVIIHKTLTNMVKKGLIDHLGNWWHFYLTEKGFDLFLKTNESDTVTDSLALSQYESRKYREVKILNGFGFETSIAPLFGGKEPTEEQNKKEIRFTPRAVYDLCCESCQKKILEFSEECKGEGIESS